MANLGPQLIKNSYQDLVQITASNALTKGDATSISNISVTSSWAINALTASFLPAGIYQITSSWAQSASNAINAQTASFLPTGTYNITASWANNALNTVSASYALSASNAQSAVSASYALSASFANTINAVYAQTASIVLNQDFAIVYAIALG